MGVYILSLLLALAVVSDLQQRRIPNVLVAFGVVIAIGIQVAGPIGGGVLSIAGGAVGVPLAIGGMLIAFLSMLPLYALRAMGAGDVKLMMMIGAFLGPLQTFGVVVLTFAAGGVLALGMALWQRSFAQLAMNLRFMLTTSAVRAAGRESPRFEPLAQTAGRMPYAVAIAAGTLLQLILVRSGGWALS